MDKIPLETLVRFGTDTRKPVGSLCRSRLASTTRFRKRTSNNPSQVIIMSSPFFPYNDAHFLDGNDVRIYLARFPLSSRAMLSTSQRSLLCIHLPLLFLLSCYPQQDHYDASIKGELVSHDIILLGSYVTLNVETQILLIIRSRSLALNRQTTLS